MPGQPGGSRCFNYILPLRSSELQLSVQFNYTILVSIAAPRPLRPAAGDGRVPGQALVYTQATTAMSPIDAHQILAATSRSP